MTPSRHNDYLGHLKTQLDRRPHLRPLVAHYLREFVILVALCLDAVRDQLAALYCPTGQGDPYDPCAMLRSWLLMTLLITINLPKQTELQLEVWIPVTVLPNTIDSGLKPLPKPSNSGG